MNNIRFFKRERERDRLTDRQYLALSPGIQLTAIPEFRHPNWAFSGGKELKKRKINQKIFILSTCRRHHIFGSLDKYLLMKL